MEKSDVVGILFRHGDDDFSLWQPESDPYFADFLEKHETDGSSVRGNSAEILSEVRGALGITTTGMCFQSVRSKLRRNTDVRC